MSEASVLQARLVGALFVERGLLTDEQLDRALELQAETGVLLGEILVTEFDISRIELASVLAEQWAELEQADTTESEADVSDQPEQPDRPRGTAASRRRIGEIFVERGFVDAAELEEALKAQKESGQPLGEVLIGRGTLSRLDLASALAEQWAGLEKLRPPAPKRVEGWQQVAPIEHAAAAAQGAKRANDVQSPEPSLDAALADAVTELSERLAAVEANGAPIASAGALAASVEALKPGWTASRARVGDRRQEVDTEEIVALRDALSELRERLSEPEARLGLVEGRVNELETDRSTIDGIRSRLAALEKRIAEQASRDDLESIGGELANRLDGLDERLEAAATGARSGLDAVLETLAGVQERIDVVETAPLVGQHEHAEIAALEARLEEVAGASTAADALVERLGALEAAGSAMPWRDELASLQGRLDELAAAGSAATDLAEQARGHRGSCYGDAVACRDDCAAGPARRSSLPVQPQKAWPLDSRRSKPRRHGVTMSLPCRSVWSSWPAPVVQSTIWPSAWRRSRRRPRRHPGATRLRRCSHGWTSSHRPWRPLPTAWVSASRPSRPRVSPPRGARRSQRCRRAFRSWRRRARPWTACSSG